MIKLKGITKKYNNDRVIFDSLDLEINKEGTIYSIMGPSGSGKTTLFNILFGLDTNFEGNYTLFGKDTENMSEEAWRNLRNSNMQMVFQDYKLKNQLSLIDNLKNAGDFSTEEIFQVLDYLEMKLYINQKVSQLSGGQKQRCAIARAMLFNPKILLLDEPTSGLDLEMTSLLMDHLNKLKNDGLTVIIITHDEFVQKHSDIVYYIQNKRLELKKDNSDDVVSNKFNNKPLNKDKLILRYVKNSFKANKFDLIILSVPIIIIFSLFIMTISLYYNHVMGTYNRMFSGISNQLIMIDTQELKQRYVKENLSNNINSFFDGKRIYFSKEDLDNVQSIEGVEEVALTSGQSSSVTDLDGYEIDLKYPISNLPDQLKADLGFFDRGTTLNFKFSGLTVPSTFIKDYNLDNINVIEGDFPNEKMNDILIPDIYAKIVANETNNYKDLIGKKITISTFKYENPGTLIDRDYVVSGIYKTNYEDALKESYSIYFAWDGWNPLNDKFDLNKNFKEDKIFYIGGLPNNAKYLEEIFKDINSYKKAIGLGYSTMLIRVTSPDQVIPVTKSLESYFPKYRPISRESWKNGEFSKIYKYERNKMLFNAFMISLILGLLIVFLNKGYFRKRNEELAVLYCLGYSRLQLIKIILIENLLTFFIFLAIAYLLSYITFIFYLSQMPIFNGIMSMFDTRVIILIILLVLFIVFISVAWNIRGIKIKNLIKSLNYT